MNDTNFKTDDDETIDGKAENNPVDSPKEDIQTKEDHHLWWAFGAAIYQVTVGWLWALLAMDQIFDTELFPYRAVPFNKTNLSVDGMDTLPSFISCVSGAGVGAVLIGLFYLQSYAAERGVFSRRYFASYLLAPLAIPLIGAAAFALILGGLVVFASGGTNSQANPLAFFIIGIVAGMGRENLMYRLEDVASSTFGMKKRKVSQGKLTAEKEKHT